MTIRDQQREPPTPAKRQQARLGFFDKRKRRFPPCLPHGSPTTLRAKPRLNLAKGQRRCPNPTESPCQGNGRRGRPPIPHLCPKVGDCVRDLPSSSGAYATISRIGVAVQKAAPQRRNYHQGPSRRRCNTGKAAGVGRPGDNKKAAAPCLPAPPPPCLPHGSPITSRAK